MLNNIRNTGFTVIELMVTVAILAITLSLAIPSFQGMLERHRLNSAVEDLAANLRFARSEAIKRNQEIAFAFSSGANWKYAIGDGIGNDPNCLNGVDYCTFNGNGNAKLVTSADYNNVSMTIPANSFGGNSYTIFQPQRGTAINNGTITLGTDSNTIQVTLSAVGHVTY